MAEKKGGEALGISGFTLAMAGMFGLILMGPFSLPIFIVGFIFCWIQQKRKSTKLGKSGLIINGLGIIASLIWGYIFLKYLFSLNATA
ncbi:MAG: hypothetical protein Q8P15_01015 [Nanoarchaeota archaeon]|nr:hypothetical protein [Nanoarchaeota archaeon]